MAKTTSGWYMNSLALKFLFTPFKIFYTLFLIILVIFGMSLLTQTYFHQPSLISQETKQLEQLGIQASLQTSGKPVNIRVAEKTYRGLATVFYEWTTVNQALAAQNEQDDGYKFKMFLTKRYELIRHFDSTLKVIAIRIGNLSLFAGLAILYFVVAVTDGLVMRAIRQKNASRESAGIYHRAKYWRVGITYIGIMFYLCLPFAVHPYWLFLPVGLCAAALFLQAKYLKKYL